MKTKNAAGLNRRSFFSLFAKGTVGAIIINAIPFGKSFSKTAKPVIAAKIHPDAVKRTKRG